MIRSEESMKKPKIARTSGKTLSPRYTEAIGRAGGEPVVVTCDAEGIEEYDGLLLSGGGDIAPEKIGLYNYDKALIRGLDPARDELELRLAKLAFERKLPTLGICRGIQVMNVALGGTLLIDIPGHSQESERYETSHEVFTAVGSKLWELVGARTAVNSFHHQAVEKIAPGLKISAVANDGINEGIEAAEGFFIGVQWHPECLRDEASEQLFTAFIGAAQ